MFLAGLTQRQAKGTGFPAHEVQSGFDRDGIHLAEEGVAQGLEGYLQLSGGSKVVLQAQLHQLVHLGGDDIGRYGDDAFAAQSADGNGFIIVAGPDVKVRRAETADALHGAQVPGGLLDAQDVAVFRQLGAGLRGDGHAGAGGNIVEDYRAGDGIG